MLRNFISSLICCALIALSASAQEGGGSSQSKTDEGGCPASSVLEERRLIECRLNCGLLSYPAPKYPATAKAAKVSGEVVVELIVNTDGRVAAARTVCGHPLLLKAALDAAYQVRFRPMKVSGRAVPFRTKVRYNFVAPAAK